MFAILVERMVADATVIATDAVHDQDRVTEIAVVAAQEAVRVIETVTANEDVLAPEIETASVTATADAVGLATENVSGGAAEAGPKSADATGIATVGPAMMRMEMFG